MTRASGHRPVLLSEALEGLALRDDGWYVDATYGRGGHSAEILARLGAQGRLLALDKDPDAVAHGANRFAADSRFTIEHAGFEELGAVAAPWLAGRRLAGVLLDLGVSSPQLDQPERGFSFANDGPLDMRMNYGRRRDRGRVARERVAEGALGRALPLRRRAARAANRGRDRSRSRSGADHDDARARGSHRCARGTPARPHSSRDRASSKRFGSRSTPSSTRSSARCRRRSSCSRPAGGSS